MNFGMTKPQKYRHMKPTFLFCCLLVIVSSCDYIGGKRIHGNGNNVAQSRNTGKFNSLDVSGAIDVYVKQDSNQSVKVETDENLQEYVEVYESNGVLVVSPKDNYNLDPSHKIKVFITAPSFRVIDVSGASTITSENKLVSSESLDIDLSGASEAKVDLKTPRINTEVTGASTITLTGETKDLNVVGSGASGAKCFDLMTENTTVDISGASSAEVFASVKLDAQASGASEVKYRGNPAITQDINGASSIRKAD